MRILVVDDQAFNRDILLFILEDEGHEIVEAENGLDACARCKADTEIDLVLMDVNMPEMDGISATREIKTQHNDKFVPIIFVTALDDTDILSRCLEAGGDDFVPKPVNEDVLLAKINAHARSRNLYNNLKTAHEKLDYHRRMMDREHAIVEHVFAKCMARVKTRCINVDTYTSPASMFDGDLVLISPSPSGGVYILVGDFTGHGLAASIASLPVTEIFFQFTERQASVSLIAREINTRLFEILPRNMFFCATLMFMEYDGSSILCWSGGMNDLIVVDPGRTKFTEMPGSYMPLGILAPEEFDDRAVLLELSEGTEVYIYTDGVNEAQNKHGEEFGYRRVHEIILNENSDVISAIKDAVHEFCEDTEQADDISIVKLKVGKVVHCAKESDEVVDVAAELHRASSFPWSFKMHLEDEDLKNTSVVNQVICFVSSIQGIELHQDKIFTIVSELFSNALEHGVLGLDSSLKLTPDGFDLYYKLRAERLENVSEQSIDLDFSYIKGSPNKVILEITDSGKGFDYQVIKQDIGGNEDSFGRGITLLDSLCSSLKYSNNGCTVTAVYELRQH